MNQFANLAAKDLSFREVNISRIQLRIDALTKPAAGPLPPQDDDLWVLDLETIAAPGALAGMVAAPADAAARHLVTARRAGDGRDWLVPDVAETVAVEVTRRSHCAAAAVAGDGPLEYRPGGAGEAGEGDRLRELQAMAGGDRQVAARAATMRAACPRAGFGAKGMANSGEDRPGRCIRLRDAPEA